MLMKIVNDILAWAYGIDERTLVLILIILVALMFTFTWVAVGTLDRDNENLERIIEGILRENEREKEAENLTKK